MDWAEVVGSDELANGMNGLRELVRGDQKFYILFESICKDPELSFFSKLDQVQYISRYLPDEELQPRVQSLCYNLQSELKNIPTFIHLASDQKKMEINDIWRSDLEWDDKLTRLDEVAKGTPIEYQCRYFRWRFIQKRDLIFDVFGEDDDTALKRMIKALYQSESTLDEFGKALYQSRHCFKDERKIINFLIDMNIHV
ncbi:hypothetical protein WR25_06497 [Diploscapter pachys]|uniref:Uncharacterized protein n=1 Tax=Diploscapter pachys TaxID=2018661 RepID=A0A2A2J337_9BILA|nr:hypothetical protein WR25_06497 [Diploscapter pachys]